MAELRGAILFFLVFFFLFLAGDVRISAAAAVMVALTLLFDILPYCVGTIITYRTEFMHCTMHGIYVKRMAKNNYTVQKTFAYYVPMIMHNHI